MTHAEKLARVLDAMGGLYTVADLLTAIGEDRMQSFAVNNSWAVTEVAAYPRARKLNILALVGDRPDLYALHDRVLGYAADNNIGLVSAYGRKGWMPDAAARGWRLKAKSFLYHKDM